MITMTIKSNEYKTFALFHVSILQSYAILVTFKGFPVFEIRKNLDIRKILVTPKICFRYKNSKLTFICHLNFFEFVDFKYLIYSIHTHNATTYVHSVVHVD